MTEIRRRAHAKLNVFLRVMGRRPDGFHDIETLILPLELHDDVTVSWADGIEVTVAGPRGDGLTDTLATAAADALAGACGASHVHGAAIAIDKHIPVAAGLGGGSADAAATLLALRELWSCDVGDAALREVAARVGSDVPALLTREAVFCSGRGEVTQPVHAQTTYWVVKPFPFSVSAADAYAWWDDDGASTGPDPGVLVAAVESGNDELTGAALSNDLRAPVVRRHPEVGAAIEAFEEAGALGATMSGSGPTVVALARHLGHADRLADAIDGSLVTSGPPRTMTERSGVV